MLLPRTVPNERHARITTRGVLGNTEYSVSGERLGSGLSVVFDICILKKTQKIEMASESYPD